MESIPPQDPEAIVAVPRPSPVFPENEVLSDAHYEIISPLTVGPHLKDVNPILSEMHLRSAISPIRRVPTEILALIFLHCDGDQITMFSSEHIEAWMKLGLVCSQWNEVLWKSPSLLNHITLNTKALFVPISKLRRFLQKIFSRNDALISLKLEGYGVNPVIDIIALQNHRIGSLALDLVHDVTLPYPLSVLPNSFTQLKHLTIEMFAECSFSPNGEVTPLFQTTANLSTLTIYGMESDYAPFDPTLFLFPFSQLTNLHIADMCVHPIAVHNTLRQCTALIHCFISVAIMEDEQPRELKYSPLRILMAKLESLEFEFQSPLDWNMFFEPFVCPSVKVLEIQNNVGTAQSVPLLPVSSFIERSSCSLSTFRLSPEAVSRIPFVLSSSELERLLWELPLLTKFSTSHAVPPVMFQLMQQGLLQYSEVFHGDVFPEGLNKFLDLMEFYSSSHHRPQIISISCHDGPGFNEARERYVSSHKKYEQVFDKCWRVHFPKPF